MSYLCSKCRSNSCNHIDPRLFEQLAKRYMDGYRHEEGLVARVSIGTPAKVSAYIKQPTSTVFKDKKLLLLRRGKC